MNLVKKNFDIIKYLPGYNLSINTYTETKKQAETLRDDIIDNQHIRKVLRELYIISSTEVHQDGGVGTISHLSLKKYLDQKLVGIDIRK